ncbi:unnamed protein product [Macrosiphum euphorbiae]|uniref:G-protein coupled receptors family 2 profile 2 domain-containing protein n=1 Tax=Macrosiphum euphorbiae TaxID=13131 RepID=A0AAV0WM25_9HEMI|nr:unnamed protein product [Macrosiphum euphorbiae]
MNNIIVRSYFATTFAFLVVAFEWRASEICCNSSTVVASCQNKNRTFHTIEALGGGTCDDNRTAWPIRKCCPLGQSYDMERKLCLIRAGVNGKKYLDQMMGMIVDLMFGPYPSRVMLMVGYNYYEQPLCDAGDVLFNVRTEDIFRMLKAYSRASKLTPGYCCDLTPSDELVARTCHGAAVVCCNSSSVASGGGDVVASCQNKNRTFHTVHAIGGGTCDDNRTAVPIRKCCPLGQSYDAIKNVCRPDGMGIDEHLQRMMRMMLQLMYGSWEAQEVMMVGYNYEQPLCDAGEVLVDVPTAVLEMLMQAYSSASELPPGYCFDRTSSNELVALTCHPAAVVCCNSSSVASGGGDVVASCQNKNRTFHTVHAIGGGTCDDNRTAVPIRKCCPLGQSYDAIKNVCRPYGVDGDEQIRRMMSLLRYLRLVPDAGMVGYNYEGLPCDYPYELLRQPDILYVLLKSKPSKFPEERCFDLSPSGELVGGLCMRGEHCLNNTCVHRCCKGDQMIVDGSNGPECILSEKPFTMSAYEVDEYGRQARSNRTVLPYHVEFKCSHRDVLNYGFRLTEDGSLYLTYEHHIVPPTEYCLGYSQVTDRVVAYICDADFVYMVERARAISIPIFCRASHVASAVCLALALLAYGTLPSLRDDSNYYVKCYMSHQLVSYVFEIAQMITENRRGHTCVLFGYITLFVFLSTLCWLNVICFDIYWMLRNYISINRNTSTSVRTIMYHFYCWGLSSIFVCTGLVFKYSQDESLQTFAPDFGEYGCFYYHMSGHGGLVFILIPMSVMLTANLILFRLTAIHSSRVKSELNKFYRTDSRTEHFLVYKEKFVMSIKLFLIIGIPYFLTVLSIVLRIEGTKWNIIYSSSSLQGVFIFIIFVAKHQVIMDLRKIFRGSMDHSGPTQYNIISGSPS